MTVTEEFVRMSLARSQSGAIGPDWLVQIALKVTDNDVGRAHAMLDAAAELALVLSRVAPKD